MHYRIFAALAAALAAPSFAQAPAAPAVADHSQSVPARGSWSYVAVAGGSEARFLDAARRSQLTLTCNRASRIVTISRPASAAAPYLQVWTTSQRRNLPATFIPQGAQLRASLAANDGLLDAMAMSRGRIAVAISGQPALVAPAWGEIDRVVEDCRA
jgi:hypothetical protein